MSILNQLIYLKSKKNKITDLDKLKCVIFFSSLIFVLGLIPIVVFCVGLKLLIKIE